jgi:hypothetical protein
MFCQNCGKELSNQASFCPSCGHPTNVSAARPAGQTDRVASPYSRLAALLLCFFVGVIGVHRFYVGKVGTGVAMIFTLGGLGIWVLIDFIMIVVGGFRDVNGKYVLDWQA